jgi:hypothetical protein
MSRVLESRDSLLRISRLHQHVIGAEGRGGENADARPGQRSEDGGQDPWNAEIEALLDPKAALACSDLGLGRGLIERTDEGRFLGRLDQKREG